jgi:hypothetical protein
MTESSQLRKRILTVEASRNDHVQGILRESGPLRRGSLVTIRRKCGKPNCHCSDGEGHLTTYLSSKIDGTTRMQYVPADMRQTVAQEAHAYRRIRKYRASLAKLSAESLRLIDEYEKSLRSTEPVTAPDNLSDDHGTPRAKDKG